MNKASPTNLEPHISEKRLQQYVNDLLRYHGAYVYHPFDARRSSPGYPDTTIVTPGGRLAFLELKTSKGKLTAAQEDWLERLSLIEGATVAVLRPADMDWLEQWIKEDHRG